MKKTAIFLALALTLGSPTVAAAAESWQDKVIPGDVEAGVICVLDNCNMVLASCDNQAAQQLRGVIREKMYKEGMSKQETFSYLSQVYGEKVLAAPPKRGFNWVAWLAPYAATLGGGALIYLGLEKWVLPTWKEEDEADELVPISPEDREILDKELKKYL